MKTDTELDALYDECSYIWGLESQLRQAQEECAELILAISHFIRGREDAEANVMEELADTYLMVNQLIRHFGKDEVMNIVNFKSNRVQDLINKDKEKEN